MNQLDQLLNIPDPQRRIESLIKYARSLGIDPIQAQNSRGQYNEEKLAILIFDTTHNIRLDKRKNWHFASGAFVFAVTCITLTLMLPRLAQIATDDSMSVKSSPPKTYKAYDQQGQAVRQDQQPVLFELMEGTYQQFDADGHLKYEMDYVDGELVRRREYAPDGRLIVDRTFTKDQE